MKKSPRPKLPVIARPPFFRVHYLALERHLSHVYKLHNFRVLEAAGAGHGLCPEYLIRGEIPAEWRSLTNRIRTGAPSTDLWLILTMLCADGDIPSGWYVIDTKRLRTPLSVYKETLQRTLDPLHHECVQLKEQHRNNAHFRKAARIIDRSLLDWLKKMRLEER